jgi:predicted MFS family arabinose efflux permease
MVTQGVVFTFLPLMAHARGLSVGAIGVVFLILGVANTGARIPAGWLLDRTEHASRYALGGILVAALSTALLAAVAGPISLLAVAAVFGTASGIAGVAMGVALSQAAEARVRGLVMGGYSTCLYLGLALGSFALGPIIARYDYVSGFAAAAAATVIGTLVAAGLWRSARPESKLRQGLPG